MSGKAGAFPILKSRKFSIAELPENTQEKLVGWEEFLFEISIFDR